MSETASVNDIDFGRSYLYFTTTRVNHTPRLVIDAACTLVGPEQVARRYFLTCPCVGERMYVPEDLIHEPVAEFRLAASPRSEFLVMKNHASASDDVRSAHRFGETFPTHDGEGARFVELDVTLAHHSTEPIADYASFRDALLGNRAINGRTTYTDEDGKTVVTMDYPVKTGNVAHDQEVWQVDA